MEDNLRDGWSLSAHSQIPGKTGLRHQNEEYSDTLRQGTVILEAYAHKSVFQKEEADDLHQKEEPPEKMEPESFCNSDILFLSFFKIL